MAWRTGSNVGRRGCDHPQDVAAAGLVGQRLSQVAGLRLHLVEQPHILDRDHGLVGEGLQQLLVMDGEGTDLYPRDTDHADRRAAVHQRRNQHAAKAARSRDIPNRRSTMTSVSGICTMLPPCAIAND